MRYGNAIVREYPRFTKISCFNYNVCDETKIKIKHKRSDRPKDENESKRVARDRARAKIFDIALLNEWQFFVTFTFNDKIVDAHDYEESIKHVKKWCQNQVQRYGLRYLLVPELHPSSGRVHLHGLLAFERIPTLQASGHFDGSLRPIYNLPLWSFGFSTVVRLDDNTQDRVAKYITKYITKELDKIVGNYYYAGGKGLQRTPVDYCIMLPYDSFEGREYVLKEGMKCKIALVTKENQIDYTFHRIEDNDFENVPF